MAQAPTTTKTSSPTVAPAVAQSIQSQINSIQAGINSLKSGGSSSSSSGSNSGVGAVNAQGQLIGANGQVIGMANPADRYSSSARQPTETPEVPQLPQVVPDTPLAPEAQAPQELVSQANQIQSSIDQLAKSKGVKIQQTATGGYATVPDLATQQREAFNLTTQTGQLAPQSAGAGAAAVRAATSTLTPQTESASILGPIQESDSIFDGLFLEYDKFFSPQEQRTSLLDEYNNLSKSLGIDKINQELIDTKRIIEGTEDDIRAEITSAGGMATDSQVLAMANSRNKQLIKNYNYLLDTKNAATTQLTTMMNLSIQDRQFAEAEFDRKLNFGFQVAQFKQTAANNARQTYLSLGEKMGWDTLLASVTPYERGVIGKTIGLDTNGLNNLALRSQQDRKMKIEEQALDAELKKAQISNIKSEIEKRRFDMNPGGIDEKTLTKIQSSPEYKTINGVLPAITAVRRYLNTVNDTGSFELFNSSKSGQLKADYGNAIAAWKSLAALGALSGADFGLAENVIPEPAFFARDKKVKAQLTSALQNGLDQATIMTTRLSQTYPTASNLLGTQLDDIKLVASPDKYTRGDDGLIYEIQ